MKKLFVIFSLFLAISLLFGIVSCSKSTPTPTTSVPTTTSAATPTPTKTFGPVTLAVAPINVPPPPAGGLTEFFNKWGKLVAEKTNGRVKLDIYFGQTLAPVNQIVDATSKGIADIGGVAAAQEPGKLPLDMVSQLPGFGTDYWAQSMAFWDLMNQDPLKAQYASFNLLPISLNYIADYYLISRDPINSVADLKGKKINASGFVAETLAALGAVPVAMSPPEQYEGLQKGTINADTAPYSAMSDFRFYEVAKYVVQYPFGGRMQAVLINKNSWAKVSPEDQKIILSLLPDTINNNTNVYFAKDQPLYPITPELIEKNGLKIVKATDADIAAIKAVQAGQADKWAADTDKKGLPGSKILADYRALVEKYNKQSTFAFK
jgi:TRAP-type C4-dicarboxylate transport system substrate-binding protein